MKASYFIVFAVLAYALGGASAQYTKESSVVSATGGSAATEDDTLTKVSVTGQPAAGVCANHSSGDYAFSGFLASVILVPDLDTDADGIPDELDPDNDNDGSADGSDDDKDGDTIPDSWELTHFTTLANASESTDNDGDGSPDVDEFLAKTLPLDPFSFFNIRLEPVPDRPDRIDIVYEPTYADRTYRVRFSVSLTQETWSELADSQTSSEGLKTTTRDLNAGGKGRVFYRVDIELSP